MLLTHDSVNVLELLNMLVAPMDTGIASEARSKDESDVLCPLFLSHGVLFQIVIFG